MPKEKIFEKTVIQSEKRNSVFKKFYIEGKSFFSPFGLFLIFFPLNSFVAVAVMLTFSGFVLFFAFAFFMQGVFF